MKLVTAQVAAYSIQTTPVSALCSIADNQPQEDTLVDADYDVFANLHEH